MAHQGRYLRILTPPRHPEQCCEIHCGERECTFRYEYPDGSDAGWLCAHHARKAGFCPRCGHFIAGSGEETSSGLCRECCDEWRAECADDDDDFDEDPDYIYQNCGAPYPGGPCTLAGTEQCDFECPLRDPDGDDPEDDDGDDC